jgi:hypothetical protein
MNERGEERGGECRGVGETNGPRELIEREGEGEVDEQSS